MQLDRGYLSPHFVTDPDRMAASWRWHGRLKTASQRATMKLLVAAIVVASTLSSVEAARFNVAPACKKAPCKQAIARCVKEACAQFRGIARRGCKLAAKNTLYNSCTVFGDYARFCADLSTGNGCAPN